MNEIARLVPGFDAALRGKAATLAAFSELERALHSSRLSPRTQARIALAVAQQVDDEYCIWAMERMAEATGLSGEDLVFARMGSAIDRWEAAVLRLAGRLLASPQPIESSSIDCGPFSPEQVMEIRGHVARAVLTCYVLQSIAPRAGTPVAPREPSK
jgi:hypothetical protein